MNTIKALIEFFTHLSKGNQFTITGLLALPFFTPVLEGADSKILVLIIAGAVLALIGQGIDYFYPYETPENPPAIEDCDAHVIIRKDTGIIVDSYRGGPFATNMAYLKQAMHDGKFKQSYSIVSISSKSKYSSDELNGLVGQHADVAFSESLKHEGFNPDWARKAQ